MPGDSCRVGWPGSMSMGGAAGLGSRRGRRLAAALFNKITDAGVTVHPLSTRILLRRTACVGSGLAGRLSIATSSSMCPPAHGRLGILASLLATRGRRESPLPLQGQPSHSLCGMRERLGLMWGPSMADCSSRQDGFLHLIVCKVSFKHKSSQRVYF